MSRIAFVTIAHVAQIAGVSIATVSRVLNSPSHVHPDKVRAVRLAMQKVRYEPQGRGLGRKLGSVQEPPSVLSAFAMVVPEVSRGLYWSLQQGFAAKANELHHQILVCNTKNDVYRQGDEILQLLCKKVAGVAIVSVTSAPTPPTHVSALHDAGIPVVVLHRAIEGVEAPLIHLPLEQIAYTAGRAALEKGHRRVAFLAGNENRSSQLHAAGLRRALREGGVELADELLIHCAIPAEPAVAENEAAVSEQLDRLWGMPEDKRPTAIYVPLDWIAEVVYLCLIRMGLSIPQDVSLIGFGDSNRDGAIAKRLTSVVVDESDVGARAVELITEMRRGKRSLQDREQFHLSPSLSLGQTLAAPPPQLATISTAK